MGKTPVSVIIPVRNEAENLERCLPALAWADEAKQHYAEEHNGGWGTFLDRLAGLLAKRHKG